MIQTLSKQGGRRYGQMGLGQGLLLWLRSVGASASPVFSPWWIGPVMIAGVVSPPAKGDA